LREPAREFNGRPQVREWLHWGGSQQSQLHASALGQLLQDSAAVLQQMNVPVSVTHAPTAVFL